MTQKKGRQTIHPSATIPASASLLPDDRNWTQTSIKIQAEINLGAWTVLLRLSSSSCFDSYLISHWLNWMDFRLHSVAPTSSKIISSWAQLQKTRASTSFSAWETMSCWLCLGHIPSSNESPWPGKHAMLLFAVPEPSASSLEPEKEPLWKHRDYVGQYHLLSLSPNRKSQNIQGYTLATVSVDLTFWDSISLGKCTLVEQRLPYSHPISALENRERVISQRKIDFDTRRSRNA